MLEVLKYVAPSLSLPAIVILGFLFFPEKLEKWWAIILKGLSWVRKDLRRRYVTHDLQGRVNDFVRRLRREVPGLSSDKLRIAWVDETASRKSFLENDEVVLRLRREDPEDHNFIHGAYLFVSESLLKKPKRYVSPSQREALDLYVCSKLLEEEKESARTVFLDEYLHPRTKSPKDKVGGYIDDFAIIDGNDLFFPVLLQELDYMGEKVFGRRQTAQVVVEVDALVRFLKPIATRNVGDETDLHYQGTYSRFGLVIIGKPSKLIMSIDPYVHYIRENLVQDNAETIYLLALAENRKRLEEIYDRFDDTYEWVRMVRTSQILRYRNDRKMRVASVLLILRRKGVSMIQASA